MGRAEELVTRASAALPEAAQRTGDERAVAIRRQIGDATGVPESLFHLGLVHQVLRGDWDVSIPEATAAEHA